MVLLGTITNRTDEFGCLEGDDLAITTAESDLEMVRDLLDRVKEIYGGRNYPGFFWGQCLQYDASEPTVLLFDVPVDEILYLRLDDAEVPLGAVNDMLAGKPSSLPTSTPTRTPRPSRTPTILPTIPSTSELSLSQKAISIPLATPTPESALAEVTKVSARANRDANLRSGPGTEYDRVGSVSTNAELAIIGLDAKGEWYQLDGGQWIAAFLVDNLSGPVPTLPPTPTQTPTLPPSPTATLTPSPTLPPLAPSCQELKAIFAGATGAQWDYYSNEAVRGTWIVQWQGIVRDVEDWSLLAWGYPMFVDIEQNCDVYIVLKDEQEALTYSAGQQLIITVQVDFVSEFWGSFTYYVDEDTMVFE